MGSEYEGREMKRSEFINLAIDLSYEKLRGKLIQGNERGIVEAIIDACEELGMKPPCSCSEDDTEKGYGPRCGISWHLHEWSEE